MKLPLWVLSASYSAVERAFRDGALDWDQWCGYRAIWRYGAVRFSNVVPWPPVRAINAWLDREKHGQITIEYDSGTEDHTIARWPVDFAG